MPKAASPRKSGTIAKPSPTEPQPKAALRMRRWLTLGAVLLLLVAVYSTARDVLYRRFIYGFAQNCLDYFATGSVESIGTVQLTVEGNLMLHDAVVTTFHRERRRVFYRAERMEIALDGWPMQDEQVRVSRVDLFHPEIWVVRETGGDWNILWAFLPAPKPEGERPQEPRPPPDVRPVVPVPEPALSHPMRGGWPRNGVHIHDGIIHVVFVRDDGSEMVWDIHQVNTSMTRAEPGVRFGPMRADFYGGVMLAEGTVPTFNPFHMDLQVSVKGADVGRIAAGQPFIKRPLRGTLDGVVAMTSDQATIGDRPVAAGRIEINNGDLWDLPTFVGILATLALTEVGDRKLEAAHIEFTVERDRVRIDQMDFLGTPLCLFGEGRMDLTGENIDIKMIPLLGQSWNDILPVIGAPVQWLLEIVKGTLIPVRITGAFWAPKFNFDIGEPVSEPLKKLIEEKAPRK